MWTRRMQPYVNLDNKLWFVNPTAIWWWPCFLRFFFDLSPFSSASCFQRQMIVERDDVMCGEWSGYSKPLEGIDAWKQEALQGESEWMGMPSCNVLALQRGVDAVQCRVDCRGFVVLCLPGRMGKVVREVGGGKKDEGSEWPSGYSVSSEGACICGETG
ncbi:hypothetical protein SODALDRAFT_174694 [Sodiomyces alkalinus F11]|uniref:Uncharacterized protein n=1 Tax=Sodiomyces alkalinus (strain CBS 110278 / VKM F-3762 / F11) TaxID=1314773 RepID=A0A3N2PTH2_SODAK|nr:hypothetical protein SODALDRAFT_174694 [Sodiomyces alkalinus F11]ROT37800.1 hypothetical protein SODALDRAFT_174694 [Sodiomyces alkalinus F11]